MITQVSSNDSIETIVRELASRLLEKQLTMATAESCTGGWIAQELTAVSGSSAWFDSGFVTYSNEAKQRMLDVPMALFEPDGPGAVSEETVRAMTAGAINNSLAQLAVAVSGIAGPAGGSDEKPVGTVWVGWQLEEKSVARRFHFPGGREEVRKATVLAALRGLIEMVS